MSGFDPTAVFEAVAATFPPETMGLNVHAFVPATPVFPAMGVFPAPDFIDYWGTFGDNRKGTMRIELRTAFTYNAENSMRALFKLISSGTGHPLSIIDRLRANKTLGGLVDDLMPRSASIRVAGEENAGLYEAVIPVDIIIRRSA